MNNAASLKRDIFSDNKKGTCGVDGNFLFAVDKQIQEKEKIKNQKIIWICILIAIIMVSVTFIFSIYKFYEKSLNMKISLVEDEKKGFEEKLKKQEIISEIKEKVILWNKEYNKNIDSLILADFSDNVIAETPKQFELKIIETAKQYNIPASILSAQIWVESNYIPNVISFDGQPYKVIEFTNNVAFFGNNQGKIWAVKQIWNSSRRAYDVYVKYTPKYDVVPKSNWHLYDKECSVGLAQQNLARGGHDTSLLKDALDPDKAIVFACDRWRGFLDTYKKDSVFFIAMAYNTPGTAKTAQKYLDNGATGLNTLRDVRSAEYIIKYGNKVLAIARNQKLKEIYQENFGDFLNKEDFISYIPEMELLSF